MQLLSRMKEIEKKGAFFYGQDDPENSPGGSSHRKLKLMPKINNSTANLSNRLKDMLFNKRDEGYYFRKFQREKSLENTSSKNDDCMKQ